MQIVVCDELPPPYYLSIVCELRAILILTPLPLQDKIPHAYRIGNDAKNSMYYDFWQDADHVQGE
jgi:hypothetical protein